MQFVGAIALFFFGLVLPVLLCLVHAGLRMRNMRNKLNTAKIMTGLKQTPMGILLDNFGMLDDLRIL